MFFFLHFFVSALFFVQKFLFFFSLRQFFLHFASIFFFILRQFFLHFFKLSSFFPFFFFQFYPHFCFISLIPMFQLCVWWKLFQITMHVQIFSLNIQFDAFSLIFPKWRYISKGLISTFGIFCISSVFISFFFHSCIQIYLYINIIYLKSLNAIVRVSFAMQDIQISYFFLLLFFHSFWPVNVAGILNLCDEK